MEKLLEAINYYVVEGIEIQDIEADFQEYLDKNPEPKAANIDDYIRVEILKQGGTICDNEQLARMYAYTYTLSRCEAIFSAIRGIADLKNIIKNLEYTLVVDFGCGPATVALAFSYYYHRMTKREAIVDINYIGKDLSSDMIYLAKDVLSSDLFNNDENFVYLKGKYIDENGVKEFKPEEICINNYIAPETILFVFSYIFSQGEVVDSVQSFIDDICEIIEQNETAEIYHILYLNKDYQHDGSAYDIFVKAIEEANFTIYPDSDWRSGKPYMHNTKYNGKAIRDFDTGNVSDIYNMGPLYYQLLEIRRD